MEKNKPQNEHETHTNKSYKTKQQKEWL